MQKRGTMYNARKTVEQPQVIEQRKQSMSLRNVALVVLLYRMCQRVLLFLSTGVTDDAVLLAQ